MVLVLGLQDLEERRRLSARIHGAEMMRKYEGFRVCNGMSRIICDDGYNPCCGLVLLYARLGLHRYNFLQGKDFELRRVQVYNKTFGGCASASYYITLEAEDPALPGLLQTFQIALSDRYGKLALLCSIARPLGETKKDPIKKSSLYADKFLTDLMPELPLENPFKNTNRFYVLKKSELQDNDWIRLYLELAVASTNRCNYKKEADATNLNILQVSIETTQDLETPNQGHNVYDATFCIRYKNYCEDRVGKDVNQKNLG